MSIKIIKILKKEFNLPIEVCKQCNGDGEIVTFCGHDVEENCNVCGGKGWIRTSKNYIEKARNFSPRNQKLK